MLELKAGTMRCEVVPELGGCIAGLWLGDTPVLRSSPGSQLASARQSGCYALVPFSNRIGHASLLWEGTQHPLVRNNGDEPHAIHGVGWQRPWSVLEADGTTAMLAYEHRPDAGWPFAFDCSHALRVSPGALELTLALTNQAPRPAPVGLGWHPFFPRREGARVRFHATGRWEMGADKLPTVRRTSPGVDAECDALDVDHCYDGWDGAAQLEDGEFRVTVLSGLKHLVAFCAPGRADIALEPVSHVNNAVHLVAQGASAADLGLQVLQPGETLVAQMTIAVEPSR